MKKESSTSAATEFIYKTSPEKFDHRSIKPKRAETIKKAKRTQDSQEVKKSASTSLEVGW